jgi:hypothetical protein
MVKSIYREHHWPYDCISGLFCDSIDPAGIEFIYEDIVFVSNEIESKSKKQT